MAFAPSAASRRRVCDRGRSSGFGRQFVRRGRSKWLSHLPRHRDAVCAIGVVQSGFGRRFARQGSLKVAFAISAASRRRLYDRGPSKLPREAGRAPLPPAPSPYFPLSPPKNWAFFNKAKALLASAQRVWLITARPLDRYRLGAGPSRTQGKTPSGFRNFRGIETPCVR